MSAAPRPTLVDSRRQFWWGENDLIDHGVPARIGTSAWTIYTCLLRHVNAQAVTFPSIPLLMAETGLSNKTISNGIGTLQTVGLIQVDRTSHQWNVYRVMDALRAIQTNGWEPVREEACVKITHAQKRAEQVKNLHEAGVKITPEQVKNLHAKENQRKRKKERGVTDVTGIPYEGGQSSASVDEPSPAKHSSSKDLNSKDFTHEGLRNSSIFGTALASVVVVPQVEASQPDGAAVAAGQEILVNSQDLAEPRASMNEQATSLENVPGGAAAGAGAVERPCGAGEGAGMAGVDAIRPVDAQELAGRPVEPVDGEAHSALKSLVGGKNLTQLTKELTRTGGLSREPWFKLTAGEIGVVQKLAQAEAKATGGNMLTLAVRGLDRLIGAVRVDKSTAAKAAAAKADPQLLAGQRCMVLEEDASWVQGRVEEVHEVQYRIVLDDRSVRKIDRTSAAKLQTLRASDAPVPTAVAPAPEGPALFAPVGSSWRRVTGKGGQLGEVITVQAVLGTKRKLSNGGELAFYTIQKDFEPVSA